MTHWFVTATAHGRGLQSRVTLNDKAGIAYDVEAQIMDFDGRMLREEPIGHLMAHGVLRVPISALLEDWGIPDAQFRFLFNGPPADAGERMRRLLAQDHHIEHFREGFASGVLYQTPPMNQGRPSSFVLQAPKAFVTESRRTEFQLFNFSPDTDYAQDATVGWKVRGATGSILGTASTKIPANGMRYVDVLDLCDEFPRSESPHGLVYVEAACENAGMIAITWNVDDGNGTFDLEHSLPPYYYGRRLRGPAKQAMIDAILE